MHRRRSTSIQVNIVGAEGCDFELKSILYHNDYAEVGAYSMCSRKNFLHLFGMCIRDDINVLRRTPANHVAHATAGEIGGVARAPQTGTNFPRRLFHERCFHLLRAVHPGPLLPCGSGRWRSIAPISVL